jgi:PEP-CTERM motif
LEFRPARAELRSSTLSYTLSDVSFGSRSTGTGPQLLSLYMSTDGFASDFTSLGTAAVLNNSTWAAINFSGLSVAIPNNDSTISFRIYGSGVVGTPTAGTATWRIDDVAFELGNVPEPSVAALFGLSGLAFFLRMRKKNS